MNGFASLGASVTGDLSSLARELLVLGRIFARGVADSLNAFHVFKALKKKEIRSLVWNCLFLNAFIFVGSNLLYSYALTPFFNWLTTSDSEDIGSVVQTIKWVMDFFWMVRERNSICVLSALQLISKNHEPKFGGPLVLFTHDFWLLFRIALDR